VRRRAARGAQIARRLEKLAGIPRAATDLGLRNLIKKLRATGNLIRRYIKLARSALAPHALSFNGGGKRAGRGEGGGNYGSRRFYPRFYRLLSRSVPREKKIIQLQTAAYLSRISLGPKQPCVPTLRADSSASGRRGQEGDQTEPNGSGKGRRERGGRSIISIARTEAAGGGTGSALENGCERS